MFIPTQESSSADSFLQDSDWEKAIWWTTQQLSKRQSFWLVVNSYIEFPGSKKLFSKIDL